MTIEKLFQALAEGALKEIAEATQKFLVEVNKEAVSRANEWASAQARPRGFADHPPRPVRPSYEDEQRPGLERLKREKEATARTKEWLLQNALEIDVDVAFAKMRERFVTDGIALFRPYPPHQEPSGRCFIGGLPDLPKGIPWPRATNDTPYNFMAQIDCAELPRLDTENGRNIPNSGTLLFFITINDEFDVSGPVAFRIVFDAASQGSPRAAPKDLPGIDNFWKEYFQLELEEGRGSFPRWPLKPVKVSTLPTPFAFMPILPHVPRDEEDYLENFFDWRQQQVSEATGQPCVDWQCASIQDLLFTDADRPDILRQLRSHAQTGFPWVARGMQLAARALLKTWIGNADDFKERLIEELEWAEDQEADAAIPEEYADDFIKLLNEIVARDYRNHDRDDGTTITLYHDNIVRRIVRAAERLITETGADKDLAGALPSHLFYAAYAKHAPINGRDVQFTQMLGYVPSQQAPLLPDHEIQTLFQLQTDWGLDMILGDCGEIDFRINPEDLLHKRWQKVIACHTGC